MLPVFLFDSKHDEAGQPSPTGLPGNAVGDWRTVVPGDALPRRHLTASSQGVASQSRGRGHDGASVDGLVHHVSSLSHTIIRLLQGVFVQLCIVQHTCLCCVYSYMHCACVRACVCECVHACMHGGCVGACMIICVFTRSRLLTR